MLGDKEVSSDFFNGYGLTINFPSALMAEIEAIDEKIRQEIVNFFKFED